jgi:SAM-dependent methyltransferase
VSEPLALDRDEQELEAFFARTGPWQTRFAINGRDYGGPHPYGDDGRVETFLAWFPQPGRVLELGSLEGGASLRLARSPAVEQLTCLEGRPESVERARAVLDLFGVGGRPRVEVADLELARLADHGRFDTVFHVGLLYHLTRPWAHLAELADVVEQGVFLDTHYSATDHVALRGYRGRMYRELGRDDPMSGLRDVSFWPTLPELKRMLADAGFTTGRDHVFDHPNGPRLWLELRKV